MAADHLHSHPRKISAAAKGLGAVTSIDLHVVQMSYDKPTTYIAEVYNQSYNRKI